MTLVRRWGLPVAFSAMVTLFFALAIHLHWSDTELWPLGVARNYPNTLGLTGALYKPFFQLVLSGPAKFFDRSADSAFAARIMFACIMLLTVWSWSILARIIWGSRAASTWIWIILLTSPTFFLQGARLRSDLLALAPISWGLLLFLGEIKRPKLVVKFRQAIGVFLFLIAFLITPKAILSLSCGILFLLLWRPGELNVARNRFGKVFLVGLAGVFFYLIYKRQDSYVSAAYFVRDSIKRSLSGLLEGGHYVKVDQFLLDHSGWFLFAVFVLIVGGVSLRGGGGMSRPVRAAIAASLLSVLWIFLYPERLPFFLFSMSMFPFLLLSGSGTRFQSQWRELSVSMKAIGVALILVQAGFALYRVSYVWRLSSNAMQAHYIEELSQYFKSEGATLKIFDPVAVIRQKDNYMHTFVEPSNPGMFDGLRFLWFWSKPDFILISPRLSVLMPQFKEHMVETGYFSSGSMDIFMKGRVVKLDGVSKPKLDELCEGISTDEHPGRIYLGFDVVGMIPLASYNMVSASSSGYVACSRHKPFVPSQGGVPSYFELFGYEPID